MKHRKRGDPLAALVQEADAKMLRELVQKLAANRPEIRRECFVFLKQRVSLDSAMKTETEAEIAFSLWNELEPDLAELDEYGGGPDETEESVGELLYELSQRLKEGEVPRDERRALIDEVIPYIRSGNAGMDDALYEVAYAACADEEDWRYLAHQLEALGRDWPVDHARRIYRRIGDRAKYLALRAHRMEYGADYHDLATFFWEAGEREQALEVAREGMEQATGRMDELRSFLAERARESGDREGYLQLQFAQATDRLTAQSYLAFKELCTADEWKAYEPKMLAALAQASWKGEQLKIHMIREEYDRAMTLLSGMRYPNDRYGNEGIDDIAAQLEEKYPEQILAFYMSGLGDLKNSYPRETYARQAKVALKVRHMWHEVIKRPEQWDDFAKRVKEANRKRPAFQEEFAKQVPGWRDL